MSSSLTRLERARKTTPGGVHSNVRLSVRPHPLFFARAEGAHLWDVDGNKYVDFVLGQGPMLLGHSHPVIVGAVTDALRSGQLFAGQHDGELELAELLCEVIPCAERIRFSSTGSEAVHAALRLARAATSRKRVIKFEGHYHGWFDSVYAGVSPANLRLQPSCEATSESAGQIVPTPAELTVLPWNDAAAVVAEVEKRDVAAVIMEPLAANHSVICPVDGFLETVRAACNRTGTVLVFDEIITGFRLGLGGAQERLAVVPDLAVFGKAMASGFPISCVAGRASLFEGVDDGRVAHAGTFNGNVSAVAAARATLTVLLDEPDLYAQTRNNGVELMSGLRALSVPEMVVQGVPELLWIGFGTGPVTAARDLLKFDQERTARLSEALARRGLYVTARGTWYLSTAHSTADIRTAVDLVGDALEHVSLEQVSASV